MRTLLAAFVVTVVAPTFAQQQPPTAPATLMLRGVVVTANDVPLPRVRVAVMSAAQSGEILRLGLLSFSPASPQGILTDDRGQFTIRVPATASARLTFTKARYVTQSADIPLRGQNVQASDIRVRMSLAGAISGEVLDRSGVRLMSASVGLQRVGAAASDLVATTTTNDLGEYRFGGLVEGRYVVQAQPAVTALGADFPDRQKVIDAATVEGPAVNVSVGLEVGNINLTIETPSEVDYGAANRPVSDPDATGSVSGRVVGWDGAPIARAVVHAYRPFIAGRQVETDERGRYRIDRLIPGEYTVEVRKHGFNSEQYGLDRTPIKGRGRSVTVQKDQSVSSTDVMLARGGVIAGSIVDEFGAPAQDVVVVAFQIQGADGQKQALRAEPRGRSRTDDRGQYRVFGLGPGTYVVQAVVADRLPDETGYLPQFYPGTVSIDQATSTNVDFSTAATGIDLTLFRTAAHRVTGVVVEAQRRPVAGEVMLSVSERSGAVRVDSMRAQIKTDGSFEFTNVAPGEYVVQANGVVTTKASPDSRVTGNEQQFAASFVTVTATDPPPMQLRLTPGTTLRGRVSYEGVPPGPTPLLVLTAVALDRDRSPQREFLSNGFSIRPDGSFEFKGVFGPTLLRAQPQRNDWYLKSVVIKGQDVTDTPFDVGTAGTIGDIEVVISTFGATVTGRVADDRAAPIRDYAVAVFSTFSDRWSSGSRWVKVERPLADGTFLVTGLPPGDYWVAAVDRTDIATGSAPVVYPETLESLSSRAVRVTLSEGQSQELALRLVRR